MALQPAAKALAALVMISPTRAQSKDDPLRGGAGVHEERHGEAVAIREGRADEARADVGDPEALGAQVEAHALDVGADGRLAGAVGRRAGETAEAREARHDGQVAAAPGGHGAAAELEGADGGRGVDPEDLVGACLRSAVREAAFRDPGVRDDEVQGGAAGERLRVGAFDGTRLGIGISDVHGNGRHGLRTQLLRQFGQLLPAAGKQDHVRAAPREFPRQGGADPGGRAGDERTAEVHGAYFPSAGASGNVTSGWSTWSG